MSYKAVQTGVANVIKKLSDYSSTNVSVDDYRILNDGVAKAVILRRGASSSEVITMGMGSGITSNMQHDWIVNCELFLPFVSEIDTQRDSVIVEAQAVVDELNKWPKLDAVSGVRFAKAVSFGEPEEYTVGRGRWFRQVIQVDVIEDEAKTLSE